MSDSNNHMNLYHVTFVLDRFFGFHIARTHLVRMHDDSVELTLKVPRELYAQLERIKEIYSHIEPGANWLDVLRLMANDVLQKRDPLLKKVRAKASEQSKLP